MKRGLKATTQYTLKDQILSCPACQHWTSLRLCPVSANSISASSVWDQKTVDELVGFDSN